MSNSLILRLMAAADIPGVLQVQQDAYSEHFHEPATVIAERLSEHPHTAWVVEINGLICAYLVGYHSRVGKINPLHAPFATMDKADCLYLHDLAIHSRARGLGVARQLILAAQTYVETTSLAAITLTAVQGSQQFWARFGFDVHTHLDAQQKAHLQTYVDNNEVALYLIKRL